MPKKADIARSSIVSAESSSGSPTSVTSGAKVLVASDNADDLEQVVEHLKADHHDVSGSTDAADAVAAFESLLPQVVVLAFDQIQSADRYLLGLYRHSQIASSHPHRTVLLCAQADVRAAYDLCKKGCYDDYMLYWPMAQDGLRLSMSVWNAAREVVAEAAKPNAQQLKAHAEQLKGAQTFFEREAREGRSFKDTGTAALEQLETAIETAIDEFGKRISAPQKSGGAVRDSAAFARELERLKKEGVRPAFREGAKLLAEAAAWPGQAGRRLQSMAAEAQALATSVSPARRTLMVVEDDEVQRELIVATLHGSGLQLMMLPDGASLVGAIRRTKPSMILMDINLPDVDGVTLTRMISGLPRLSGVPVLMLTGEASKESLAKSIEAGAVGYVVKPFTAATLLRNIDRFLPKAP